MSTELLSRMENETLDDMLLRLGHMKETGELDYSWRELAMILYAARRPLETAPIDESAWRKRYAKLKDEMIKRDCMVADNDIDNDMDDLVYRPRMAPSVRGQMPSTLDGYKILTKIRDERSATRRDIRVESRTEELLERLVQAVERFEPPHYPKPTKVDVKRRAVYALLSDIHYGIRFNNAIGEYSPEIAAERVMRYADRICEIGMEQDADECYVSLLGDMISGMIHSLIRVENRENIVQQVIGVSELVARFLYRLAESFSAVYVNSVSGNHSRIELFDENAPRAEKLDDLVVWFCATKLEHCENVIFEENTIDSTICSFDIFGKTYCAVHGDYDKKLADTANRLTLMTGMTIDYMIAGHMHVPDVRLEHVGYIRNGSVCGSGDEYTAKKRLFSPPCQVCLVVNEDGVLSINPVKL